MSRVKQVILIRRDLSMRRDKEIAQGAHAATECLIERIARQIEGSGPAEVRLSLSALECRRILEGTPNVCLKVGSEAELLELKEKAEAAGLQAHAIQDAGRTEFHGVPTLTALAIGPEQEALIDQVTGSLVPY